VAEWLKSYSSKRCMSVTRQVSGGLSRQDVLQRWSSPRVLLPVVPLFPLSPPPPPLSPPHQELAAHDLESAYAAPREIHLECGKQAEQRACKVACCIGCAFSLKRERGHDASPATDLRLRERPGHASGTSGEIGLRIPHLRATDARRAPASYGRRLADARASHLTEAAGKIDARSPTGTSYSG